MNLGFLGANLEKNTVVIWIPSFTGGIVSKWSPYYFFCIVSFQWNLGLLIDILGDDTKLSQSFLGGRHYFVIKEIQRQNSVFISIVFASL